MLHRIHSDLHAVGEVELAKDALHMNLDGGFRQVEHSCDFLVAGAMSEHDDVRQVTSPARASEESAGANNSASRRARYCPSIAT